MRIHLDLPLSFHEISKYSIRNTLDDNPVIEYISTDTRNISRGDLFIALRGENNSGENYIYNARELGAYTVSTNDKNASLMVADSEDFLLDLAKLYKSKLKNLKFTVGITGSLGKTTTKEFAYAALCTKYKVHKTNENHNNKIGAAETVLSAPKDTELLLLEMGMNNKGEIKRISQAISPDYAIITNIGLCHIGNLGSREEIAKAKLEILSGMKNKNLIAPYDEPLLLDFASNTFSVSESAADFYICNESHCFKKNNKTIKLPNLFPANHLNHALCASLAITSILGLKDDELIIAVDKIHKANLRQKFIQCGTLTLYDDTYSSSPEAVNENLKYLRCIFPDKNISCVLGDMLELGERSRNLHKYIGSLMPKYRIHRLYVFGSYAHLISEGAKSEGMPENMIVTGNEDFTYKGLAIKIMQNSQENEIIMFKASHKLHADKIIEELCDMVNKNVR